LFEINSNHETVCYKSLRIYNIAKISPVTILTKLQYSSQIFYKLAVIRLIAEMRLVAETRPLGDYKNAADVYDKAASTLDNEMIRSRNILRLSIISFLIVYFACY